MPDDLDKRGKQDRDKVSSQQHEIDYLVRKFPPVPEPDARLIQQEYGPWRAVVEGALIVYQLLCTHKGMQSAEQVSSWVGFDSTKTLAFLTRLVDLKLVYHADLADGPHFYKYL